MLNTWAIVGNIFSSLSFFPSTMCKLCGPPHTHVHVWSHLLSRCGHPTLHDLDMDHCNKAYGTLKTLTNQFTKWIYVFINDFGFPIKPIVPLWLLPCSCSHLKCSCLAKWHPRILLLDDLHTYSPLSISPTPSIHIQFIEFKNIVTIKFLGTTNTPKTWKIQPCLNSI